MPNCLILAGPNGAGKTTAARHLLPGLQVPAFVNADHIAVGLSAFNPESVAVQAGRILLDRLRELAGQGADFAFETTLATRIFAPMIRQWRADGYTVRLLYFYLPSPTHCHQRVAARVAAGGHHIPDAVVVRRYGLSLRYLFELYQPVVSEWAVFDNHLAPPQLIADSHHIADEPLWHHIRQQSLTA